MTGNELEFMAQGTTAYQMNVKEHEKSLVSILEEQCFKTSALHPYPAENWNRENVYSYMGFDVFYAENNWGEMEILRWVASDKSAYKKVIEIDEESTEKQFVFLVTMQNHGGYTVQWEGFENDVFLNYGNEYPQAEQFLSLMQESDRALKELLEYYEKSSEPTMIIIFGDHQPAVEEEFYEELYGKELQELSFEEKQSRYVTPFIIWANYEIEEQNNVEISSNYLGSYILEQAGLELSPYNRFLIF